MDANFETSDDIVVVLGLDKKKNYCKTAKKWLKKQKVETFPTIFILFANCIKVLIKYHSLQAFIELCKTPNNSISQDIQTTTCIKLVGLE